jgi:hypothetical protein
MTSRPPSAKPSGRRISTIRKLHYTILFQSLSMAIRFRDFGARCFMPRSCKWSVFKTSPHVSLLLALMTDPFYRESVAAFNMSMCKLEKEGSMFKFVCRFWSPCPFLMHLSDWRSPASRSAAPQSCSGISSLSFPAIVKEKDSSLLCIKSGRRVFSSTCT